VGFYSLPITETEPNRRANGRVPLPSRDGYPGSPTPTHRLIRGGGSRVHSQCCALCRMRGGSQCHGNLPPKPFLNPSKVSVFVTGTNFCACAGKSPHCWKGDERTDKSKQTAPLRGPRHKWDSQMRTGDCQTLLLPPTRIADVHRRSPGP